MKNVVFLFQIVLNVDNYLTVINNTVQLTLPVINLTEADIIYTADILYNFQIFELADQKVFQMTPMETFVFKK